MSVGYCRHKRAGIVSSHPLGQPIPREDAHCSVTVCGREECIAKGIAYVAGFVNGTATFYPDDRPGGPFDREKMGTPREERLERYRREHEEATRAGA